MKNPFIGTIIMFAGVYAPKGWAFCDGQILQIAQYETLFTVLGTTYGGDGRVTFGLPDLRARVPVHQGTFKGAPKFNLGMKGGSLETNEIWNDGGNIPYIRKGEGKAYNNLQPFQVVNFIIALEGDFPPRS